MNIRLKERQIKKLIELEIKTTFKILESSFVFMKVDVEGLTVQPNKLPDAQEDPKPIIVLIPEGKTSVLCLSTGKAQFLNLNEKVQIVELEAVEVVREKEDEVTKGKEK